LHHFYWFKSIAEPYVVWDKISLEDKTKGYIKIIQSFRLFKNNGENNLLKNVLTFAIITACYGSYASDFVEH